MSAPFFPTLLMTTISPGEHFAFYLARHQGFGSQDFAPKSWLWPSGLATLIDQFRDYVGTHDQVLSGNTLYPLFARFLPDESRTALRTHLLHKSRSGIATTTGLGGPLSGWVQARIACCPHCIEQDVAPCGKSFWRRDNLIPGLLFCRQHEMPLHVACSRCADFRRRSWMTDPRAHCGCGLRAIPAAAGLNDAEASAEIELAKATSMLLDPAYLPGLNHSNLAAVVARAACEQRLTRGGQVDWSRVEALLQRWRHQGLLMRTGFPPARHSALREAITGKRVLRHPAHSIILLKILHGTWRDVERSFLHIAESSRATFLRTEQPRDLRKPQSIGRVQWLAQNRERYIHRYTQEYRQLRELHPSETHTALMRRLPSGAATFISRKRLSEAGVRISPEAHSNEGYRDDYDEELDASLSRHVRDSARALLASGHRQRLSRTVLFNGHRMTRAWARIKARLPLTIQALAECEETRAAFARRLQTLRHVQEESK